MGGLRGRQFPDQSGRVSHGSSTRGTESTTSTSSKSSQRVKTRNHAWRLNNLAKVQFNLNQTSLVTAAFVVNQYRSYHAGIGPFFPKEATRRLEQAAYLVTLKHQSYFSNGMFLELGFGATQFEAVERALGDRPFVIAPQTRAGNFFRSTDGLGQKASVDRKPQPRTLPMAWATRCSSRRRR